jgi:hypothetical protein
MFHGLYFFNLGGEGGGGVFVGWFDNGISFKDFELVQRGAF